MRLPLRRFLVCTCSWFSCSAGSARASSAGGRSRGRVVDRGRPRRARRAGDRSRATAPLATAVSDARGEFALDAPATRPLQRSASRWTGFRAGVDDIGRLAVGPRDVGTITLGGQRRLRIGRGLGGAGRDSADAGDLERHGHHRRRDSRSRQLHSVADALRAVPGLPWQRPAGSARSPASSRAAASRTTRWCSIDGVRPTLRRRFRLRPPADGEHRADRGCPRPAERALRLERHRRGRPDRDRERRSAVGRLDVEGGRFDTSRVAASTAGQHQAFEWGASFDQLTATA